jgi:hypothetical protein
MFCKRLRPQPNRSREECRVYAFCSWASLLAAARPSKANAARSAEAANSLPQSAPSGRRKTMPSQGFPREGFGRRRVGRKYDYVRSNGCCRTVDCRSTDRWSCSCLPASDEAATAGLPDNVDGAGLWGRRRSLRLRRSMASSTGLGQYRWRSSSDEANSGEQRSSETHRHPPMERRHPAEPLPRSLPPEIEGYLANASLVDESG